MQEQKSSSTSMLVIGLVVVVLIGLGIVYLAKKSPDKKSADGKKDKIVLQLKWVPQAQFAGYFVADKKGYFADENLEVEVRAGGVGINPVDVLVAGDADVAVAWTGNVLPAIAKGEDIVNIGQGFQKSGMVLVAKKKSGINAPADIKSKKIGVWAGGNETEPFAFIAKQGLDRDKDVQIISQAFDMNQLFNDEIQLASAMTYNELELVYENGYKPEDLTVFNLDENGSGMLQDALFVKRDYLTNNKDILVRFLRASMKGWDYAVTHQEEAVDMIGMDFAANDVTARPHQIKSMAQVAKLTIADKGTSEGLFYIDQTKLANTVSIAENFVKEVKEGKKIDVNKIYTQEIWDEARKDVKFSDYKNL
ncbi:MAG: ABC transporter substrate-binding protein [bacterium]